MAEELVFTMDQEPDSEESRAAKTGSTAAKKKTTAKTSSTAGKTGSTASKKKTTAKTGSTAAKKTTAKTSSTAGKSGSTAGKTSSSSGKTGTTAAKKKTTSSSIRLSSSEKKLIENYRKCNDMTKTMISAVVEKIAGTKAASQDSSSASEENGILGSLDLGNLDLGGLLNIFGK